MTKDELKKIAVYASAKNIDVYYPLLNAYMPAYGIAGKLREAAFIATVIHESGSFKYTREIASGKAYEGRKDLGNTQPGDGVKYAGRGLIQLTGRTNYEKVSKAFVTDYVGHPELIEQPDHATKISCWWWASKGLNAIADKGDIRAVTKVVNGGQNGIKERTEYYERALNVLK